MSNRPARKAAFVLAATDQGTLIVNRFDYRMLDEKSGIGVGFNLLDTGACDPQEVKVALAMLDLAKIFRGPGVAAVDCGANIGVHTVEWARAMTGWGSVTAFEAQERVYYALAGNLALNNCFNASARHAAVGLACGTLRVPVPDYLRPGSFAAWNCARTPTTSSLASRLIIRRRPRSRSPASAWTRFPGRGSTSSRLTSRAWSWRCWRARARRWRAGARC